MVGWLVHPDSNLTAIAIVFSVALICGLLLMRIRQPAIIGYILAGAILGPTGFGVIGETEAARTLAELGVLLLLFLVGMELSLKGFKTVFRTALIVVAVQIALSLVATIVIGQLMSWPFQQGILLGFVLAISSTAVTIKVLSGMRQLGTTFGRMTVGVLIAQDLAVVAMLLVIEGIRPGAEFDNSIIWRMVLAAVIVVGLVRYLSRRERISLPLRRAFGADLQVVPIAALAFCGICATMSGLLGLSTAFGAFLAGLVVGNSTERRIVLRGTRPIESVLLATFFLSVGLLIDARFLFDNIGTLLVVLILATVIKGVINVAAFRIAGESWEQSVLAGVTIGQIGEFGFIIAGVGLTSGAIGIDGYKTAVAVIALSLMLGPAWVELERRLRAAEDLGGRLSRAERAALDTANRLPGVAVQRFRDTGARMRWPGIFRLGRHSHLKSGIWPPRLTVRAEDPADRKSD